MRIASKYVKKQKFEKKLTPLKSGATNEVLNEGAHFYKPIIITCVYYHKYAYCYEIF